MGWGMSDYYNDRYTEKWMLIESMPLQTSTCLEIGITSNVGEWMLKRITPHSQNISDYMHNSNVKLFKFRGKNFL